jgi:riboflavin biosynthesis pyrimidine reductase
LGIKLVSGNDSPHAVSNFLKEYSYNFDYTHLLVEPGPTLATAFFESGLVDRVWVFRSPTRVGDDTAPTARDVPGDFVRTGEIDLAGDILTEYLNPRSPVFFAAEPSADLVLTAATQASQTSA